MRWVFWFSFTAIIYTYVGYPLWLWFRARYWPRPVEKAGLFPSVSIIIAARNESRVLRQKLRNLDNIEYPQDLIETIVVSDGSTDETNQILAAENRESLRVIVCASHGGKANALNQGMAAARGEIVVFTDARQKIEPGAVRNMVMNFADPSVGCVTGELMLNSASNDTVLEGVGLYWQIEKCLRKWESAAGSVLGATGAIYAARRCLLVPLPAGTILDDVYLPLEIVRQGFRIVFESSARAFDVVEDSPKKEFRRKVRTLTGNYQLIQLAPWILTRKNPLLFQFVSHKLARLAVPFALMVLLLAPLALPGTFYRVVLLVQLATYALGALVLLQGKPGFLEKPARVVFGFLLLNAAAFMAMVNFIAGRKQVWVR